MLLLRCRSCGFLASSLSLSLLLFALSAVPLLMSHCHYHCCHSHHITMLSLPLFPLAQSLLPSLSYQHYCHCGCRCHFCPTTPGSGDRLRFSQTGQSRFCELSDFFFNYLDKDCVDEVVGSCHASMNSFEQKFLPDALSL